MQHNVSIFIINCISQSTIIIIIMSYLIVFTQTCLWWPCMSAQQRLVLQMKMHSHLCGCFLQVMCHMSLIIDDQGWIISLMDSFVLWCVSSKMQIKRTLWCFWAIDIKISVYLHGKSLCRQNNIHLTYVYTVSYIC